MPKYVTPLPVLPPMPLAGTVSGGEVDYYDLAERQFRQQILPAGFPASTVWGYGSLTSRGTFHTPALPVEARVGRQVRVTWRNQLVDTDGDYLPHLFTVDPTLHWANPPGGPGGRDSRPTFTSTPPPYTGPVPMVVHLHGGHTQEDSDGYPENWYLPAARNIPSGYATSGSSYDRNREALIEREGVASQPGSAVFQYTNDQRATALWVHDHSIGMTRLNAHAGLIGYYLLRGGPDDLPPGVLPGPAPAFADHPPTRYYEVPIVVQDRAFNADGSIFFPDSRGFFGDTPPAGPWIPDTDVPPYWNPESFGSVMVVNGTAWPSLHVEPRRYRFRLLNAANARTLILKIVSDPLAPRPAAPALPVWHIGADGGFLPAPAQAGEIVLGVAERSDVIVDFTGLKPGTKLYLINEGPDQPFNGSSADRGFADPGTSGQVMRFDVVPPKSADTSVPPSQLTLPSRPRFGAVSTTRNLSMNEADSTFFADAPAGAQLGIINPDGTSIPLDWHDPLTETPTAGTTEEWVLTNLTDDTHPIHLHQVEYEVVNRQPMGGGPPMAPESWETGTKDTVLANPGQYTRIKVHFDIRGRYVWHCHILDHEDNEMMRPYQVS